jgi:hypothetical protein
MGVDTYLGLKMSVSERLEGNITLRYPGSPSRSPKVMRSAAAFKRIIVASGDMLSTIVKPCWLRNTWFSILATDVSLYLSSAARVILFAAWKMHFLGSLDVRA